MHLYRRLRKFYLRYGIKLYLFSAQLRLLKSRLIRKIFDSHFYFVFLSLLYDGFSNLNEIKESTYTSLPRGVNSDEASIIKNEQGAYFRFIPDFPSSHRTQGTKSFLESQLNHRISSLGYIPIHNFYV